MFLRFPACSTARNEHNMRRHPCGPAGVGGDHAVWCQACPLLPHDTVHLWCTSPQVENHTPSSSFSVRFSPCLFASIFAIHFGQDLRARGFHGGTAPDATYIACFSTVAPPLSL